MLSSSGTRSAENSKGLMGGTLDIQTDLSTPPQSATRLGLLSFKSIELMFRRLANDDYLRLHGLLMANQIHLHFASVHVDLLLLAIP